MYEHVTEEVSPKIDDKPSSLRVLCKNLKESSKTFNYDWRCIL